MPETAPKKILPKTRDDEKPHHANSFVTAILVGPSLRRGTVASL